MKKFMLFIAVAALALGAQAYTYAFTYTLNNVPSDVKHDAVYLLDTEKNEIVAYVSASLDQVQQTGVTTTDIDHSHSIQLDGYATMSHALNSAGITIHNEGQPNKQVVFNLVFTSDVNLKDRVYFDDVNYNLDVSDLVAVAVGKDGAYRVTKDVVGWSYPDNDSNPVLNSGYTYAAVPEPTSAMLLLFGFVGLVLKRKRV